MSILVTPNPSNLSNGFYRLVTYHHGPKFVTVELRSRV